MAESVRVVDYYFTTIDDKPGEGYRILARFKRREVNFLAFTAFPCGPGQCQLNFFPEEHEELRKAAKEINLVLQGPRKAFLIYGDDKLGALADTFRKFYDAKLNIYGANCLADVKGGYGLILWVSPKDYEGAAKALGVELASTV
jgi:hypothetical protein